VNFWSRGTLEQPKTMKAIAGTMGTRRFMWSLKGVVLLRDFGTTPAPFSYHHSHSLISWTSFRRLFTCSAVLSALVRIRRPPSDSLDVEQRPTPTFRFGIFSIAAAASLLRRVLAVAENVIRSMDGNDTHEVARRMKISNRHSAEQGCVRFLADSRRYREQRPVA
jgi:hypothetical protein